MQDYYELMHDTLSGLHEHQRELGIGRQKRSGAGAVAESNEVMTTRNLHWIEKQNRTHQATGHESKPKRTFVVP